MAKILYFHARINILYRNDIEGNITHDHIEIIDLLSLERLPHNGAELTDTGFLIGKSD